MAATRPRRNVPGPAALLGAAVATSGNPQDGDSTSTSHSSAHSTPPSEPDPAAAPLVTTITTEGGNLKGVTTDTITHRDAASLATKFDPLSGQLHLRPIPPRGSSGSKIKSSRIHGFVPRISHFDRNNVNSQVDPFRGFYTLFWIMLFVGAVRTCFTTYDVTGSILGLEFGKLISEDALALALSDAVLVLSTAVCVPFVKLLTSGWLRYHGLGIVIQHTLQTLFLGAAVSWTFHRNWPWVQSGFLTLHALSTLMKVHSYCSTNGELSEKHRSHKLLSKKLQALVKSAGGVEVVEKEARKAWVASGLKEASESVPASPTFKSTKEFEPNLGEEERSPPGTPPLAPIAVPASTLTQRRSVKAKTSSSSLSSVAEASTKELDLNLLTWHPSSTISELAIQVSNLYDSLRSSGVGGKRLIFPADTVSWSNFTLFMCVPTLVYEMEYPRTNKIRPMYVLEKTLATFGTFSILYLITEHYILPISPSTHEKSFFISALDLSLPFMVNYLLIFYIIFECICNVFAELTRFADREFYQDWWNSTSFDEFSRRWNVPVHAFLLRHVYASTMTTYKFSKFQAAFVTFLLSACVHELVMAVVTKKLRMYLFVLQMGQLPLIIIGRHPVFRKYPAIGNLFFWIGLGSGFPLLAVAYLRF